MEFDAIIFKGLLRNPKDVTVGILGGTPDRTTVDKAKKNPSQKLQDCGARSL